METPPDILTRLEKSATIRFSKFLIYDEEQF